MRRCVDRLASIVGARDSSVVANIDKTITMQLTSAHERLGRQQGRSQDFIWGRGTRVDRRRRGSELCGKGCPPSPTVAVPLPRKFLNSVLCQNGELSCIMFSN